MQPESVRSKAYTRAVRPSQTLLATKIVDTFPSPCLTCGAAVSPIFDEHHVRTAAQGCASDDLS